MKQILLITDGCSNVGMDPAAAAAFAASKGITVNVIGISGRSGVRPDGQDEIEAIARAGGGMWRIVASDHLPGTVQMVTRQTVARTVRQAVGEKLERLIGSDSLQDLPPLQRAEVVQVMDEIEETADLRVALLVDTSASMRPHMAVMREAVRDLMLSLQARQGPSALSAFRFPGPPGVEAELELNWTDDLANLAGLFNNLSMKGTTPTGPALLKMTHYMNGREKFGEAEASSHDKAGIWRDYIV